MGRVGLSAGVRRDARLTVASARARAVRPPGVPTTAPQFLRGARSLAPLPSALHGVDSFHLIPPPGVLNPPGVPFRRLRRRKPAINCPNRTLSRLSRPCEKATDCGYLLSILLVCFGLRFLAPTVWFRLVPVRKIVLPGQIVKNLVGTGRLERVVSSYAVWILRTLASSAAAASGRRVGSHRP